MRGRTAGDDGGAVLVLAVLFVAVVGLIGGALVGLAGGSLKETKVFATDRTESYSAQSAIEVAIDALRPRAATAATSTPGYVPGHPSDCPTLTVPIPGSSGITVMCGFGRAQLPWERVIVFAACPSTTNCLSGQANFATVPGTAAIAVASTLFDDLKGGCSVSTGNDSCFVPGNAVDVTDWKVKEAPN
jgi:hypothetical protein